MAKVLVYADHKILPKVEILIEDERINSYLANLEYLGYDNIDIDENVEEKKEN